MDESCRTLIQANNLIGEGPIWDEPGGRLLWNDIFGKAAYEWNHSTGEKQCILSDFDVASIGLTEEGGLILAGDRGIHIWDACEQPREVVTHYRDEALCFNDMVVGPEGTIYGGTKYWGAEGMIKTGKLFLLRPGGGLQVVDEGIELSNGLDFSPDGKTLYYADSAARKIYTYAVEDSGELSGKRVHIEVPETEGIPDGLTVDAAGYLWCALWYGSGIARYDPAGRKLSKIKVPASQTSSVAFGGPGLEELYITSAGFSWKSELAPPGYDFEAPDEGGSLFVAKPGVRGKLPYRAAGFI